MSAALATVQSATTVRYSVDLARSHVQWTGQKVIGGAHTGKLKLRSGQVTLAGDRLVGGEVVADLTTLANEDLTDPAWNDKLVGHLKSADFFDVDQHPTASLRLEKVEAQTGDHYRIRALLTIKGHTKSVVFEAEARQEGVNKTVKAELTFDRADFDIRFGSGRFFQNLGDKLIADEVTLGVELALKRE